MISIINSVYENFSSIYNIISKMNINADKTEIKIWEYMSVLYKVFK